MSKNLLKSISVIGLCLVFGLFVKIVFVHASPINGGNVPAQVPPLSNVLGPLNVGSSYQTKDGSLRLTNGGFRAAGPSYFDDTLVVGYVNNVNPVIPHGGEVSSLQNSKIGFFAKLSKALGLNTDKALAQSPTNYLTVNGDSQFNGNITAIGTISAGPITSNTKKVCLEDGTNCLASPTVYKA